MIEDKTKVTSEVKSEDKPEVNIIKVKKKKKPRCKLKGCKCKLKLTDLKCVKCKKRYCSQHRSCISHNCIEINDNSKNILKLETAAFKKIEVI